MRGRPPGSPPAPPAKVDAAIGIIFALLCTLTLVLIRTAVPAEFRDPGAWVTDERLRRMVDLGLQLVPGRRHHVFAVHGRAA